MKVQTRRELIGLALISPWLIGFLAFSAWPFLRSIQHSFTRYDILRPPKWVGLANYQSLLADDGIEGLVSSASLRSTNEILDEADLIYRCHWAVRHSELNAVDACGQLDSGVTFERHHALNWLIR